MDNHIKAKQDYLYQEIIDQNYDPEQFQLYIEQKRGLNLELYSMEELINIVQAFKKGEKSQPESQIPSNDPSFIENKEHINSSVQAELKEIDRATEQNYKNSLNQKQQGSSNSYTKVYHEFVLKENTSNIYKRIHQKKQRIKTKIRSYSKIKEQYFFGSTYISYLIETPEMNWSVRRRFKDFQWLQSKLTQLLPGYPIPPIPKKTTMRSFEDQHLEERMNIFQNYINKLINIPEICSEQIIQDFLSESSQQEFNNCRQRLQVNLNTRGNRLITLLGQELINKSQYKLQLKEYEFYKKSGELMKHLNIQLSQLQQLLKQATNKAFEISSSFNQLHMHINSEGHFKGAGVLELMGDFTSELGYKLQNQLNFVHSEIQSFCKYQEKYLENIVNYMSKINRDYCDMLGRYKNLSSFEFDQEELQNINHNDKKIFQQYQQTRQNYRIKLSFLRLQIQRYKNKDFFILTKEWLSGLEVYVAGIKDLMLSGVDQLTRAQSVNEGKRLIEVQYASKKATENKQNSQKGS